MAIGFLRWGVVIPQGPNLPECSLRYPQSSRPESLEFPTYHYITQATAVIIFTAHMIFCRTFHVDLLKVVGRNMVV